MRSRRFEITPLSVIGLLERIKRSANLSAGTKAELEQTLTTMQRHYYTAGTDAPTPDLARVARDWVVKMASGTR